MAVRPTISRFPVDSELQESCGLPWGVVVAPFSSAEEHGNPPLYGKEGHLLPRCENCYGYFNTYCELDQWSWTCVLCGALNGLSTVAIDRYSQARSCPEMCSSFIDLEIPVEGSEREGMLARPVYVAAVDLSSSEEFLELVKSGLLAALEALAPGSLFGLVTFSHKIGLYDVQGPIPVVKNIFIPPDSDGRLTVDLEDAMPLLSFLAPVESCKDRIAAALETLKPTTSWERTTAAGQALDGILLSGRGFGVAMDALINYLSSEYGNTFALARIFAFLSGAPDYGAGQLDTRRYGDQYASKREDADRALLPEQTSFYKDLAAIAVQSGVCVDIFAITNEYTDLASLKFLSIESGGSLFLYSVILATFEQGVREGKLLFHDWLVILIAQYNDAYKIAKFEDGNTLSDVDIAFSQCPQLQCLPRLVFALLRNPLLRLHEDVVHLDYRIYLQCLSSALEPSLLQRTIYPVLHHMLPLISKHIHVTH